MGPLDLHYVTMTEYDASFKNVGVMFHADNLKNTIGEVISGLGKKQIRIAETEKYPHVTFFFSGGREVPFEGERRIMIPSPRDVATYDLKPEMSAAGITDATLPEIDGETADFIVLNFANTDMVGHTGSLEAAVRAVEAVDHGLGRIMDAIEAVGGALLVTADHGNCELMRDPMTGGPHTAHTTNPVPVVLMDGAGTIADGRLADIAPTLLALLGVPQPSEMTGRSLLDRTG